MSPIRRRDSNRDDLATDSIRRMVKRTGTLLVNDQAPVLNKTRGSHSARVDFSSTFLLKGGDPAALSSTATLLRLHPPYRAYLRHRLPLQVRQATSGTPNSGGVTGGVYKARERIHRIILICDY